MEAKGATKHCSWGLCKADSRYPENLREGTYFIRFPKPGKIKENMTQLQRNMESEKTEKCKRWIHACGRENFTISNVKKDTYICSQHFEDPSGPTAEHPHPLIAKVQPENAKKIQRKRKPPKERMMNNNIQSTKRNKVKRTNSSNEIEEKNPSNIYKNIIEDDTAKLEKNTCKRDDTDDVAVVFPSDENNINNTDNQKTKFLTSTPCKTNIDFTLSGYVDKSTQTIYDKYLLASKIETMSIQNSLSLQSSSSLCGQNDSKSSNSNNINPMNPHFIMKDKNKCKYFTGLTPEQFELLYNFLGPAKYELHYWNTKKKEVKKEGATDIFTLKEQLFITLLRIRRGFNFYTIAHFYFVSESYIRKIFTTWVMFMFRHFKDYQYEMFPERGVFKDLLPKVFKPFQNIRCSVDCTEFFCEVPRNYAEQGNKYSSYKHHTTMKCLIAVNPNGAACFVSDLYEGSINDVTLFGTCGILNHINQGDSVLVDKGFTVQDLLIPLQASIYIPPFLGKRESFTKEEILLKKRIAKARIHVERFNERLKKFRLLDQTIPLSLKPIISQIVYVASFLVNFQDCLCN